MRRPASFSRRLTATVAAAAIVLPFVFASAAAAHTSLIAASPEPEAIVGGTIDRIDLEFGGDVSGPGIVVRDPDGIRITGEVSQPFTNRASIVLSEALSTPGRYSVEYAIVSTDGDPVDQSFSFEYDPSAPAAPPLPVPSAGPSQLLLITVGVALGFAFVGGFTWLQKRRQADDSSAGSRR